MTDKTNQIVGALLGTAVGDAFGLPYEGYGRAAARRHCTRLRHRFVLGRGMLSDDTEHSAYVAQALKAAAGEPEVFSQVLSRKLVSWLAACPLLSVGKATCIGILRLAIGVSPDKSGVYSAGNGPAMRASIIGAYVQENDDLLCELVRRSSMITHSDPKAYFGALAVALAAQMASTQTTRVSSETYLARLHHLLRNEQADEFLKLIEACCSSADRGESTEQFAVWIGAGIGISGYVYQTVPCAIQCWLRNQDNAGSALLEIVRAGGDTDTTAAIVGGIIGAHIGESALPVSLLAGIVDFPLSIRRLRAIGNNLADDSAPL